MIFPSKVFDFLKWLCIIALPAISSFYGTVGGKLGWPAVEAVTLILANVALLLGTLLGISNYKYYHQTGLDMPDDETEVDNNGEG